MPNLVCKNQEADLLVLVNLKEAPQIPLSLVELPAEHLLMAPGVSIAEQEVHLAGLLLHLVVLEALEMIRIEGIAMKPENKEEERREVIKEERREVIKEERRREAMKGGQGKRVKEGRRGAMGKCLGVGIVNKG